MTPVSNLTLSKVAPGTLQVTFELDAVFPGFNHSLFLVGERDSLRDTWSLRQRPAHLGLFVFNYLDFYNETHHKFWNVGSSSGTEDDTGNRRFIRPLPTEPGVVSFNTHYGGQPDTDYPHLEFYVVMGVVAVASGFPLSLLGDLRVSPVITGV